MTDTSKEAVERLARRAEARARQASGHDCPSFEADLREFAATLRALLAERDAIAAAAFDVAAEHCWNKRDMLADAEKKQIDVGLTGRDYYGRRLEAELLSRSIRAITPADAKAALDRMLRDAARGAGPGRLYTEAAARIEALEAEVHETLRRKP